jgi:hypothetical protein
MYRGMDVRTQVFLTSELFACEWSSSHPGHFTLGETELVSYPLDKRLDGLQNWSKRHSEVKIIDSTGTQTPLGHSACSKSQALYFAVFMENAMWQHETYILASVLHHMIH